MLVLIKRATDEAAVSSVIEDLMIKAPEGEGEPESLEPSVFQDLLRHGLVRTGKGTYVELPHRKSSYLQ